MWVIEVDGEQGADLRGQVSRPREALAPEFGDDLPVVTCVGVGCGFVGPAADDLALGAGHVHGVRQVGEEEAQGGEGDLGGDGGVEALVVEEGPQDPQGLVVRAGQGEPGAERRAGCGEEVVPVLEAWVVGCGGDEVLERVPPRDAVGALFGADQGSGCGSGGDDVAGFGLPSREFQGVGCVEVGGQVGVLSVGVPGAGPRIHRKHDAACLS